MPTPSVVDDEQVCQISSSHPNELQEVNKEPGDDNEDPGNYQVSAFNSF